MAAQKGKDLLLKVADPVGGTFSTVAGMRSRRIAFNTETVDFTDFVSVDRWRELLGRAGVKQASISGSGIFKDAASDARVRTLFFDGDTLDWSITIPDFGILEGAFQIILLEHTGEHNGEITFEMSLDGLANRIDPKENMNEQHHRVDRVEADQGKWHPIETAPKDGAEILLFYPLEGLDSDSSKVVIARWRSRRAAWVWQHRSARGYSEAYQPTHWHPLPILPKQEGE